MHSSSHSRSVRATGAAVDSPCASSIRSKQPCWCGSAQWALCFSTSRFGLLRCLRCGTHRIDPIPVGGDEEAADFYTQYHDTGEAVQAPVSPRKTRTSRYWRVVRQYPTLDEPGRVAVDMGCGEGGLCQELRMRGWARVTGFDVSKTRIRRATMRYPEIPFFTKPIGRAGITRHSVELMTMDNVVEHLPQPLRFLQSVRPYLAEDGRLVMITPNMNSGCYRLLGRRWTPELAPHTHIYLFDRDALTGLAVRAGFTVEESGDFHTPNPPLSFFLQSLKRGPRELAFSVAMSMGSLYGRLICSGGMIWVVCTPTHPEPRRN